MKKTGFSEMLRLIIVTISFILSTIRLIAQIHVPFKPYTDTIPPSTYLIVEKMPLFPGCDETTGTLDEKHECSVRKLHEYMRSQMRYEQCEIHGRVVIQFVVEEDGWITHVRSTSPTGHECLKEAIRVMASMNELPEKWSPALRLGKPVRVQMEVPINF